MPDVTPQATPGQAAMSPEFAAELIAANHGLGQLVASLREQLLRTEEQCRRHVNQADGECARYMAERDAAREKVAQLRKELAEFAESAADLRKRFEAVLRERDHLAREVSLSALAQPGWQAALADGEAAP